MTFQQLQAEFIRSRRGAISLPLTGVLNYAVAAIASFFAPQALANFILVACFWAIPPVAALIGKIRKENFAGEQSNPLFQLSKLARVMVLATWAIHIPVWVYDPKLLSLTIGTAFALHWVVFGWCIARPSLGLTQLALRSLLVPLTWILVPGHPVWAVSAVVSCCYLFSVLQLQSLDWEELAKRVERRAPASS